MKKVFCHWLFLILSTFISLKGLSANAQSTKDRVTSVELVWEKIPEATIYELEIFTLEKKRLKNFKQKDSTFVLKLPLGQYLARMRVADERGVFGVWSEMSDFRVTVQTPKFLTDKPIQALPDPKTLRALLPVKWEKTPLATHYRFEIYNETGKLISRKVTTSTRVHLNLSPGIYHYQVIALTDSGEESIPPEKKKIIAVDRPQLDPPHFQEGPELRWKIHPKSFAQGTLEYLPLWGDSWSIVKNLSFENQQSFHKDSSLRPGQYRLTLWAKAPGWIDSEKAKTEFIIKPLEKNLPEGSF